MKNPLGFASRRDRTRGFKGGPGFRWAVAMAVVALVAAVRAPPLTARPLGRTVVLGGAVDVNAGR